MSPPPATVHTAADLRRETLRAEVENELDTVPRSARGRDARMRSACRAVVAWGAEIVSRIVDNGELIPGPAPSDAGQLEPLTRS